MRSDDLLRQSQERRKESSKDGAFCVSHTQPRELRYTVWFAVEDNNNDDDDDDGDDDDDDDDDDDNNDDEDDDEGDHITVDTTAAGIVARELYDFEGMPAYDPDWRGGNTNIIDDASFAKYLLREIYMQRL